MGKRLRGCQGSSSYHQNITWIIKKRLPLLLITHTHRGFVSLVLLVLYFYVRHTFFCSMLELNLASYARKNIISRCFKKYCHLLLWQGLILLKLNTAVSLIPTTYTVNAAFLRTNSFWSKKKKKPQLTPLFHLCSRIF